MFSDYGKISGQGTFCKTTSGSTFDQSVFLSYQQVGLRLATHWSDCVVTHCFKLQINADHHLVQCRKKNKSMDVEDYHAVDDPKTRRSKSSGGQSFVQLVIGGVMLGFGLTYQEECNNGATDYLLLGGAIIIAANILPFITAIVFELGDCDVHRSESCVLRILLIIQSWLPIVSFGVTIWVKSICENKYFKIIYCACLLVFIIRDQSWSSQRTAIGLTIQKSPRMFSTAPSLRLTAPLFF